MKNVFFRMLVAFMLFMASKSLLAQRFDIKGNWKFITGDNPARPGNAVEDKSWSIINIQSVWEGQGFKDYDGIGWYKKTVIIPSSFKTIVGKNVGYNLCVGKIDDEDETYFNGRLVGKTIGYVSTRNYLIYDKDIHWDKENTIAVRVKDYSGNGGMWQGDVFMSIPKITGIISAGITTNTPETSKISPNKEVEATFKITSKAKNIVKGTLFISVSNEQGRRIKNLSRRITILPGKTNFYTLSEKSPSALIKFETKFAAAGYQDTLINTLIRGYIDIVYKPVAAAAIANAVPHQYAALPLEDMSLTGFLANRIDINTAKRLLHVDEHRIMAGFFSKPGEQEWIGEHVGKFLDAACRTYRNSPTTQLKILIDRIAQQLIATQLPNGHLGTYLPSDYWTSWDVWVHKYNLIGLMSYYSLSGYTPALAAAKKIGLLLCNTFGTDKRKLDITEAGDHVGMAATSVLDPMTDLYKLTGDNRYLDFCWYIIASYDNVKGPKIIATLSTVGRVDKTANGKAYEMLSNLLGILKLYEITANESLLQPVLNAWQDIITNRLYITGTSSSLEHFQPNGILPANVSDNMGEGCVTVTWIQINYQLYTLTGDMKYLDEIERSDYNHLLAAENPQNGCVSYYTALMGKKPYSCDITCCLSSIPRGISMIPLVTYGMLGNSPLIAYYESGKFKTTLHASGKTVLASFEISSEFPQQGAAKIKVTIKRPATFSLQLRIPWWCENYTVMVNGKKVDFTNVSGIATINRNWKNGDEIAVAFDIAVKQIDGGISYPNHFAFQRGPQVLAIDASLNKDLSSSSTIIVNPATFSSKNVSALLPPGWIGKQFYQANVYGNENTPVILVPYSDAGQGGDSSLVWLPKK